MFDLDYHIIDIHAHLGPYFEFPIRQYEAEDVIRKAGELGIAAICVSHTFNFLYDVRQGNRWTIQAASSFPKTMLAGGVLDPHLPEGELIDEYKKCDPEVAMWGELHPALHRYPIDGEGYRRILELITINPKPVLFHTDESDRYSSPALLREIARQFPQLPIIIGHSGNVLGGFEKAVELAVTFDNVYLDSTFSRNYLGIIEWMIKRVGPQKILFGSDIPFLNGSAQVGKLLAAGISDRDRRYIFRENAAELLGLSK